MAETIMADTPRPFTGGVDTHKDFHVAAVVDHLGASAVTASFENTAAGHDQLLVWMRSHGDVQTVGVEGTGSYGAGLTRHLNAAGLAVLEINRPDRRQRRSDGKTDPLDAIAAARSALAGLAAGTAKTAEGAVETLRTIRIVRRSAVRMRTQTMNQLRAVIDTAPVELADRYRGLNTAQFIATALSPCAEPADTASAATWSAHALAQRWQQLDNQIDQATTALQRLVPQAAPALSAMYGVGADTAAALLVAAGDNPDRLGSEAAFAALCGVNPLPASSGRTRRHRLNRAGNRDANNALWRITMVRLAHRHQPTADYVARRTSEGLSKREIIRCLKRFIAREAYRHIIADLARTRSGVV